MKKVFMIVPLLFCVLGLHAAAVSVSATLARPTMYVDNWSNCYWQAASVDGTTRWQFDFDSKTTNLADGVYSLANEKIVYSYTYGYDCHDTITRISIEELEVTLSHDTKGLEHIVAVVKGGNNDIGSKIWTLTYDEPEQLPDAIDSKSLEVIDATYSDLRHLYNNLSMEGISGAYNVSVTLYGEGKNSPVGDYDWSKMMAFDTEIEHIATHKHIPAIDAQLTLSEQTYSDTVGYKMAGYLLGADSVRYDVVLYYHPRRSYKQQVLMVTDYTMELQNGQLFLSLATAEKTFQLTIHDTEMRDLHTYSMQKGDLSCAYVDADARAFINREHEFGTTYSIEANIYTSDYIKYVLIYDGEQKKIVTAMEETMNETTCQKVLRDGRVCILREGKLYDVNGIVID